MDTLQLEALLLKAKQAYYYGGTPIMSDAEYDALEDRLKVSNPNSDVLALVGSPIPPNEQGKKATHSMHMGSQSKVHNLLDLKVWAEKKEEKLYHVSFKGDGGAVAIYYVNGKLTKGITRGNGFVGVDITSSAACFQFVPNILNTPITGAVRCEAVLTLEDWKKVDPDTKKNPRNAANGILGRLDGINASFITALAFDIVIEGKEFETEEEKTLYLTSLGFKTPSWIVGSIDEVIKFQEDTNKLRKDNELPYWIDGMVVKLNNLQAQETLGIGSGNKPKGQIAWKFEAESATSKVIGIEWQVGHSGAITPVAKIEPVEIGGTTVSNVSLANTAVIKTLGLYINSEVLVIKAGDIIPQITQVLPYSEEDELIEISIPSICPVCGSPLVKKKNVDGTETVVLFCENDDCPARTLGRVKRWASSRDVLGLGDSVIKALFESESIQGIPDLFNLIPESIMDITLNGEKVKLGLKRAKSICEEIKTKGTEMTLPEFLGSFGTRGLGVRRATLMIEANPQLADINKWFDGSLLDKEFAIASGVPQSSVPIFEGLDALKSTILETLKYTTLLTPTASSSLPTVCITGALPSGKKKSEYKQALLTAGYELIDDVSKSLNYLVVSDPSKPTSKTVKATKLGVKIISEIELVELITEND